MATNNNLTLKGDFSLPKEGYLVFDSLGLKAALQERLNETGIFTDQLYAGSNLSQLIDILAYNYNTLIYYVNRTGSESLFNESQIYENINRLVKLIGYNPIGNQTSVLSFTMSATQDMPVALYNIPRYSYMTLGSISYSFKEDITLYHSITGIEYMEDISKSKLFYQGRFIEYPIYEATGDENEIVYLLPGDNVIIDHFNIDVYVKSVSNEKWTQWTRTNSLYLENSNDKKYEIRLNEKQHYEIKFGNNINGKKLEEGDLVAVYYLMSNGKSGEVGVNALQAGKLIRYTSTQYDEILQDVQYENITIIPDEQLSNLIFDNNSSSTYYSQVEDVESIRNNAPKSYRTQYRLVTESDFENYIKTNYSNLVHDTKVVNNWAYVSTYLKYFYDIGIYDPNNIGRVLFNQVSYADSCNFNNVYLFIVPKVISNTKNPMSYLNPSLKQLIISSMQDVKLLTCEPVPIDPVFMAYDIGIAQTGVTPSLTDTENTQLLVIKKANSRRDTSSIQTDIYNIFLDYFTRTNCNLGQLIDVNYLSNAILSVDGVETYYTKRTDSDNKFEGLSMMSWNPVYTTDIKFVTQNQILNYFQFPFLNNYETFLNKIVVQTTITRYDTIEY
jgi:DNA-dependent RNA polymerase auxiliary subunit epsilon